MNNLKLCPILLELHYLTSPGQVHPFPSHRPLWLLRDFTLPMATQVQSLSSHPNPVEVHLPAPICRVILSHPSGGIELPKHFFFQCNQIIFFLVSWVILALPKLAYLVLSARFLQPLYYFIGLLGSCETSLAYIVLQACSYLSHMLFKLFPGFPSHMPARLFSILCSAHCQLMWQYTDYQ